MAGAENVNQGDNVQTVVDALTLAYHRLSRAAETLHGAEGLNAGGRSILLTIARGGPATISDLARARNVSRQFIQRVVQDLARAGLLAETPNPRHRRSPLFDLTCEGRAVMEKIARVEAPLWRALDAALHPDDIAAALRVLRALGGGGREP